MTLNALSKMRRRWPFGAQIIQPLLHFNTDLQSINLSVRDMALRPYWGSRMYTEEAYMLVRFALVSMTYLIGVYAAHGFYVQLAKRIDREFDERPFPGPEN